MQRKIEKICTKVLRKVTPSEKEKEEVLRFSKNLAKKLTKKLQSSGIRAKAHVHGSVAKDTWLAGEKDIDMFVLLPKAYTKEIFPKVLNIIKTLVGEKWMEAYAEHPYIEAEVEEHKIDFVPCFKIERAEEAISSVDRTPLHTFYIKRHLNQQAKNEVRLLKRFMRGVDTYGAEIRVGGFSGYLCELLILRYKSFLNTLKTFVQHKKRIVIDVKGYYEGRENELRLLFKEPLVVVDPVDKGRNVASAVQPQKLYTFIAAARAFLKNPDVKFFFPPETVALPAEELKQKLARRGSAIIFLTFGKVEAVPDILWGQLYKSQRSLCKLIQLSGFNVLRDIPWSDEKTVNMFIFELEQRFISPVRKHLGPPLEKKNECEKFLLKHINSAKTVSGPYIEDGRWVVEIRRKYTDVAVLLKEKLRDGGRSTGVAEKISEKLRRGFKIFVNDEIIEVYKKNSEFAKFLTEFLSGKPRWLENAQQY
jgi:tRNA nucleotidyltransferase (CCA-adding enzyme)